MQVSDIIYVHNGTLNNDDTIFEKLGTKRDGEVDSEAIGHLLSYFTDGGNEPFTKEVIEEVTRRLDGTYSVIAAAANNPYQVAQFRDGRPAEFVLVRPLKTVFVASDKKYLENVLFEYNKMTQLFAGGNVNMPYLKKSDVEFETMTDDSYLIWDLTTSITPETSIKDLYDWGKTPLRVDKIWKGTTTSTNNAWTGNNYTNTSKKTVGTQVSAQSTTQTTKKDTTTTGDSDDAISNGLVWSKALNKYKTQKSIEKSKDLGAVEIDVDKGDIKYLPTDNDSAENFALTEVEKDKVENLIVGAAKTEEIGIAAVVGAIGDVKKTGTSGKQAGSKSSKEETEPADDTAEIFEVDMTTDDPDAVRAASEYIDAGLNKFENDDEVTDALSLDPSVLKSLPLYAIANRIMKFVFRKGFIAGYMTYKNSKEAVEPQAQTVNTNKQKLEKAEQKIRTLKMIMKIMGASLKQSHHTIAEMDNIDSVTSANDMKDLLLDTMADLVTPKALKRLNLSEVFSVGDMKEIPLLEEVSKALESESSK